MTNEEMANRFRKKIENKVNRYNEEIDFKYSTPSEKEEKYEEAIINYLKTHKEFAKKIVDKFTPKKDKEEVKGNIRFKKFSPLIISAAFFIGVMGGARVNQQVNEDTTVAFDNIYDVNYDSVEDAPISVQEAYINDQYVKYYEGVEEHPEYRNKDFEETVQYYESMIHSENPNMRDVNETARNISNLTLSDMIDETLPFESTPYTGSIVNEEGVYVPVTSEEELKDNSELKNINGGLFRKR